MNSQVILKGAVILGIIITLIVNNPNFTSNNTYSDYKSQYCFDDATLKMTEGVYVFLKNHTKIRNILQIITGLILDVSVVLLGYTWIMYGKTWRPVLTCVLFFGFKELCSFIVKLRPDEDYLWKYPGLPSLTISYHNNQEYFFSGTIGLFLICFLELKDFGYKIIPVITRTGGVIYFLLITSLRAQYYISLFSGLFAAHYIHYISDRVNYLMNDVYDFDVEESDRLRAIRAEKNIKRILESTLKAFKVKGVKKMNKESPIEPGEKIEMANESSQSQSKSSEEEE